MDRRGEKHRTVLTQSVSRCPLHVNELPKQLQPPTE